MSLLNNHKINTHENDENKQEELNYNIGIFDPDGINPNPLNGLEYSDQYKVLAKMWSNLPGYKYGKEIVQSILANDVLLIQSATGSGKSVLVNKFVLHALNYKGRVVMTLPKKIITKKAAEFGAKTLDVELGEQVGYQFRGDNMKSNKTIMLYSTDGSIISQIKSDPLLRSIDVILIDEAHERKVQIDLLLYLIKNAIKKRKEGGMRPLKLVIMSATINEKIFSQYYKDFNYGYMFLSGTPNYPIETIYLESSLDIKSSEYVEKGKTQIIEIVQKIKSNELPEGDILFFVCTVKECDEIAAEIGKQIPDSFTMGLYSGFDPELEQYISSPIKYKELNPNFKRRIFISTNVAESSLTIDGIVYVIDSGLELSVKYDPVNKINVMTKNFITKAQMSQRKGRAGRTKPGYCYKLYTPKNEESCLDFPEPEIKQIDLKNLCLSLIKLGFDLTKTNFTVEQTIEMFTEFIEPPGQNYIIDGFEYAIKYDLVGEIDLIGQIDLDNQVVKDDGQTQTNIHQIQPTTNSMSITSLTPLGKLIVESRLDVEDGLSLLYAWNMSSVIFKRVFKIICICSYLKSGPDDFFHDDINPDTKTNIINRFKKNSSDSEHILLYLIYKFIESEPNRSIFNLDLVKQIDQIYTNQVERMYRLYEKHGVKLDYTKSDSDTNTICSFNYGYKFNKAFRRGSDFKFGNYTCNLDKSYLDYKKYTSIIFGSNVLVNGKFNIGICSPYLLK